MRPELDISTTTGALSAAEQERLARILDDYLVAIERGLPVSPEELLAKHPDDAAQLRGYLSGLELFHAAAVGGQGRSDSEHAPAVAAGSGIPQALQVIGDYRLVREIGRGGMGVVYEAWQVSLRRRVALKILPFTSAHDAKQIGRFKNEAQAAAQVQHPNIVPVYAIGEESGVHYYVMQLIEGQSLTSLLGALRTGGRSSCGTTAPNYTRTLNRTESFARPASKAAPRDIETSVPMRANETADHIRVVARLGLQAAEALHAAHEYGVVHRDVKPSNLLLDDQGKLWVTDFGLARCRDDQGLTQTGDVLGTMRYMSPEQALGRTALVDHRTDVYSLGITMYELATFNHPADDLSDTARLFDHNRPSPKPLRHWNRHIPRDFQTIVLKCIAEFPQERYGTAQELVDDLNRFLEGRPIQASPPSLLSRASKWAKRRRGVVYAAAAVLLVALGGLIANMMLLAHEKSLAKERALDQARDYLRQSLELLDQVGTQRVDQLAPIPGAEGVRHELLEDLVELYQRFETQAVDDPSLATDLALAYSKLGTLNEKMGKRDEALKAAAKAKEMWEDRLARELANTEYARNLALCQNNLGLLMSYDGRPTEGLALLKRACHSQKKLVADNPGVAEFATDLATTHSNLGLVLIQTQAKEEAVKQFRAAIAIGRPLAESGTADEAVLQNLAASYNNLGSLEDATNPDVAADSYQKAVSLQLKLVKAEPINRNYQGDLARTYNNLGFLSSREKDWKKAELCYADAIRIQENLVKASPAAGAYQRDLAISYNNLGMVQSRDNRFAEAESSFQKAIRLQEKLLADVQTLSNQGSVWNNLGMLLDRQRRFSDAEQAYQQAVHYQSQALGRAAKDVRFRALLSRHYHNFARNLASQAKYDAAVEVVLERKNLWPGDSARLFSVAQELAAMYRQMNTNSGTPQAKTVCLKAAAATLREALEAGLPRDRLNDPSLSSLTGATEFRQLFEEETASFTTPTNTSRTELSGVN